MTGRAGQCTGMENSACEARQDKKLESSLPAWLITCLTQRQGCLQPLNACIQAFGNLQQIWLPHKLRHRLKCLIKIWNLRLTWPASAACSPRAAALSAPTTPEGAASGWLLPVPGSGSAGAEAASCTGLLKWKASRMAHTARMAGRSSGTRRLVRGLVNLPPCPRYFSR